MSLFWDYFKNTLNWALIQAPGPISAVVQGGAVALDETRDAILWLRRQSSPETCEDTFLDAHGSARGIERRHGESVEKFRVRVIRAYAWQLLGGRQLGLPQILAHYGYGNARIFNMKEEDPERWAEFRVDMPLQGLGLQELDVKNIVEVVNDQKPARSKVASVRISREQDGNVSAGGAVRQHKKLVLGTISKYSSGTARRSLGGVVRIRTTKQIRPQVFELRAGDSSAWAGAAVRTVHKIRIGAKYV